MACIIVQVVPIVVRIFLLNSIENPNCIFRCFENLLDDISLCLVLGMDKLITSRISCSHGRERPQRMWLLLHLIVMDSRVLVSVPYPTVHVRLLFQLKEAESTPSQRPKETSQFLKHPSPMLVRRKKLLSFWLALYIYVFFFMPRATSRSKS